MKNIIKLLSAVLLVANLTYAKAAADGIRDEDARVVTNSFYGFTPRVSHRAAATETLRRLRAITAADAQETAGVPNAQETVGVPKAQFGAPGA